MKRLFFIAILLFSLSNVRAQDYIKDVCLVSTEGMNATFTSVGISANKKDVELNAIESLFHTLLFDGVEDVNDGIRLIGSDKPSYTNAFFNTSKRCMNYVVEIKDAGKTQKMGNSYQGTFNITIRLKALIKDVHKNTGVGTGPGVNPESTDPRPRIMIIPFRKDESESFENILKEDWELSVAVAEVEKGFQKHNIETKNFKAISHGTKRRVQFAENANVANSNDRQLVLSYDADVYVEVRLNKQKSAKGNSISIIVDAYETATGDTWGHGSFNSIDFQSDNISQICAKVVSDKLPGFLEQIIKNYKKPASGYIEVNVSDDAMVTLRDRCKNGKRMTDVIQDWLAENAYNGVYNTQDIIDDTAIFDHVQIPRVDKDNKRMNADRFAGMLSDALYEAGVETRYITTGNNIMITVLSIE